MGISHIRELTTIKPRGGNLVPSAYKHDSKNVVYPTVFVIQEVSQDHIRNLKALSSILLVLCKRQNPI